MSNPFSITGADNQIAVSSQAALVSAIGAAKPGAVITLDTVVAPFALTINQPKASPGISIKLPATQVVKGIFQGFNLNTEIVGGTYSADTVTGDPTLAGSYSLQFDNASHCAVRGATVGQGSTLIQASGSTDLEISDILAEWPRSDVMQFATCERFLIDRMFAKNTTIDGASLTFYNDGRPPAFSTSSAFAVSSGGFWADSAHADIAQLRTGCRHFIIRDAEIDTTGQGFVSYGTVPADLRNWDHALLQNNLIRCSHPNAIDGVGDHITMIGNRIEVHPTIVNQAPTGNIARSPGTGKLQGYGNSTGLGATLFNPTKLSGGTIDLKALTMDGDAGCELPVLAARRRMPWAPLPVRPTFTAWTAAPEIVIAPLIHYAGPGYVVGSNQTLTNPGSPVVGTWFTGGRGQTKGAGVTFEKRWRLAGALVSGATDWIFQAPGGSTGQVLIFELRPTNGNGTGVWKASAAVVIA